MVNYKVNIITGAELFKYARQFNVKISREDAEKIADYVRGKQLDIFDDQAQQSAEGHCKNYEPAHRKRNQPGVCLIGKIEKNRPKNSFSAGSSLFHYTPDNAIKALFPVAAAHVVNGNAI